MYLIEAHNLAMMQETRFKRLEATDWLDPKSQTEPKFSFEDAIANDYEVEGVELKPLRVYAGFNPDGSYDLVDATVGNFKPDTKHVLYVQLIDERLLQLEG